MCLKNENLAYKMNKVREEVDKNLLSVTYSQKERGHILLPPQSKARNSKQGRVIQLLDLISEVFLDLIFSIKELY